MALYRQSPIVLLLIQPIHINYSHIAAIAAWLLAAAGILIFDNFWNHTFTLIERAIVEAELSQTLQLLLVSFHVSLSGGRKKAALRFRKRL